MIAGCEEQFIPKIQSGEKRHTIRKGQRWRAGMRIDLFRKVRQKGMKLIFRAPVTHVETVDIVIEIKLQRLYVWLSGNKLSDSEMHALAVRDGFPHGHGQMFVFWRDKHAKRAKENVHWRGQMIHWDYDRRSYEPVRPQSS